MKPGSLKDEVHIPSSHRGGRSKHFFRHLHFPPVREMRPSKVDGSTK